MKIDMEEIADYILLAAILIFIMVFPFGVAYFIWIVMAPVGFWQILVSLVFLSLLIIFLFTTEIFILAIIAG